MTRTRRVGPLLLMLGLVACEATGLDFDPDDYDLIPALEALDYNAVHAAEDWDYWEVRRVGPGAEEPYSVFGSGGELSRDELGPAARDALDAAEAPSGFAGGCLPAYCYSYIVAVEGETITLVRSTDQLREFLAPVTTPEEAILLGTAGGNLWWDTAEASIWWDAAARTGIRAVGGAWDLVLFELVRDCQPVQTDRVRLRVHANGAITERAREVWERAENMCV